MIHSHRHIALLLATVAFLAGAGSAQAAPFLDLDFRDMAALDTSVAMEVDGRLTPVSESRLSVSAIGWRFNISNHRGSGLGVDRMGDDNPLVDGYEHLLMRFDNNSTFDGLVLGSLYYADGLVEQARVRAWDLGLNMVLDTIVSGSDNGMRFVSLGSDTAQLSHVVLNAVGGADFSVVGVVQVGEPASLTLLGLGLMGMMGLSRARRSTHVRNADKQQ